MTNINFASFYRKASDIAAITTFIKNDNRVVNFPHLHAKFYVFDDEKLIVTSANLTSSGLKRNLEYGVYTNDIELVTAASNDFNTFFNDELSGRVTLDHTQKISEMLSRLNTDEYFPNSKLQLDYSSEEDLLAENNVSLILNSLSGWTKAVFEGLARIDKQVFSTADFCVMIPYLGKKYPNNYNIEAKIRQQLQLLRDIGLIKFEKRGNYKKLWK